MRRSLRRELDEPVDDLREVAAASGRHDELGERHARLQCLGPEQVLHHCDAPFGRERRVAERHAELVGALEGPREAEELVLHLRETTFGARDLEHRPGVRLDPRAFGHRYRLPTWLM